MFPLFQPTQRQGFPAVLRVVPVDPLAVEWRLTDDLVRQESVHILDATKKPFLLYWNTFRAN